jgi:hypothetical protein
MRFIIGETVKMKRDGLRGRITLVVCPGQPRYYVQTQQWTFSCHESELLPVAPGERWKGDPRSAGVTPIKSNVGEMAAPVADKSSDKAVEATPLAASPSPTLESEK